MPNPKGHHPPSDPLAQCRAAVADLTRRNAELELHNQTLLTEREQSQRRLAEASDFLGVVTTGLFTLDKNGLIQSVNPAGAAILDADATFLIKKPFGLFIPPQDQAIFYIHRSRIGKRDDSSPFEIQLKTPTERIRSVRIQIRPLRARSQHLPDMLLLMVEDITDYRQALEHLQARTDLLNLIYSMMDDLVVWSTSDIDDIITLSLEKLGLTTSADRVYACFFHSRKTRFSVTHEWRERETKPPTLHDMPIEAILPLVRQLKKRRAIGINHFSALSPIDQAPYKGFCASGTQSTLVAPLFYGRSLLGVIGADAVRQPVAWSREHERLLLLAGSAVVNALLRRQIENAPGTVSARLFPFFTSPPGTDADSPPMYDGPIEIVDDDEAMASGLGWRFETDNASHDHPVTSVRLTNDRFVSLACPTCHRQQQLDISEIRHLGSALKVTCACDTVMHVKIELRRELRKTVNLDGIIVRKKTDWKGLTLDDWNKIHIVNLSRHGVGFKPLGSLELRMDDRFEIKFNLNNTAESLIQKTAVVRSIHDTIVGCQFEGEHPCDTNIAFYVLT